jgi:hypothetical protein
MATIYDALGTRRINAFVEGLVDRRELPLNLTAVRRIPSVQATDDEITARVTGYAYAADIVADDAKAVVHAPNPVALERTKLPNLKHGTPISQAMINTLLSIANGAANPAGFEFGSLDRYVMRNLDLLRIGILQREEALLWAMLTDAFSYDRFGIKYSGVTWGMPPDLKVTIGTAWSDTANATPIADIQAVQTVGREKYGVEFNRITMSGADFNEMVATTEFRNKATLYSQLVLPSAASFPVADRQTMIGLAGRILGADMEINDSTYFVENADGTTPTGTRFLPTGKIVLTSTAFDNDPMTWDWANAIVAESVVGSMVNMPFGQFDGPAFGPVAYVTSPNADMNPPNLTLWAVARGFPRKHKLGANAVLTNP